MTQDGIAGTSPTAKWQHPPSFYCPISQQCMHDPVVLSDGHTYERRHIERWLEKQSTSPVSGLQLEFRRHIFPNHALRNSIEEYFQQIFSVHRRAIQKSIGRSDDEEQSPLLRTINSLMQCSLLVNADLSTESVLHQIMEEAKTLVGAEVASVFLLDHSKKELYSTVNSTGGELRISINVGIAGHVASTGEPVVIHDAYGDCRFDSSVDRKTGFKTSDVLCVPLKVKPGDVIGVVQLINKTNAGVLGSSGSLDPSGESKDTQRAGFTNDDLHFLHVFASQAAMAISNGSLLPTPESPQPDTMAKSEKPGFWECMACCFQRCDDKTKAREASSSIFSPAKPTDLKHQDTHSTTGTEASLPRITPRHVSPSEASKSVAEEVLSEAFDSWQMDTLALNELTGNRSLSTLSLYLFQRLGYVEHFELDQDKLEFYFECLEQGYDDVNAYHNRTHVASVLHTMHALLDKGRLIELTAEAFGPSEAREDDCGKLEAMACLLAAAMHDYEHLGVNNDFLIKTSHSRALLHSDQHVNEHHHLASALELLRRPECNFLSNLPASDIKRIRTIVIELILGTDMAMGPDILKSFSAITAVEPGTSFRPKNAKDATHVLRLAFKCADLGHLALNWDLHVRWVSLLEQEFFAQGDREKSVGLPASFLMDRDKPGASDTQVGFFEFVVLPLFRALASAAPHTQAMLAAVEANDQRWKEIAAEKDCKKKMSHL